MESLIRARKCEEANKHHNRQSEQTNFDPDDDCGEKQGCSTATISTDSSSGSPVFHVWKDKEEDYLVELRHTRHDDFLATKNHQSFWYDIAQKLKDIQCDVTPTQCFNKYSSLRKKWKEIIDSPSGSETKYFRHKTTFDMIYGHKASTKPSFSIDTMGKNTDVKEPSDKNESKMKGKGTVKGKKAAEKRKSEDMIDILQEQYNDFKDEMKKQHTEKMSRLDRLLDLSEREITEKKN